VTIDKIHSFTFAGGEGKKVKLVVTLTVTEHGRSEISKIE
jgi:hypothetical protein